jgi:RNA polymerase sigma-70 factor (ECF subfamily)
LELAFEFLAEAGQASFEPVALEATLRKLHGGGKAAWPQLSLAPETFARHLAMLWSARKAKLDDLRGDDLYLACACAQHDPRAISALEPMLATACSSLPGGTPALADEVRQDLREKLLVSSSEEIPPLIATYSGEGPLAVWLKVTAVRAALRRHRGASREVELDEASLGDIREARPDPELDYLKLRHGEDFRAAFKDAAQVLSPRDRLVLRLYYVDGLGVEKIGAMYQVHASTVTRWMQASREALMLETKRLLGERLKLSGREVESMLGLLRSGMHASLRKVLV